MPAWPDPPERLPNIATWEQAPLTAMSGGRRRSSLACLVKSPAMGSLIGHLAYGGILGAIYWRPDDAQHAHPILPEKLRQQSLPP